MEDWLGQDVVAIAKAARDYSQRELASKAKLRDEKAIFPEAELQQLAKLGMMGICIPEKYGGVAAGPLAYAAVMRELAAVDAGVSVAVSVTNMVAELVANFGSDSVRDTYLPRITDGSYRCASFALSEPQAGSDPSAMQTVARKVDGGFVISGNKQWITSGDKAGIVVVWAVTKAATKALQKKDKKGPVDAKGKHRTLSAFVVPGNAKGLTCGPPEKKMGLSGSTTVSLRFDEVFVPDSAVLAKVGEGFRLAMKALDGGRIGIGAQATGIARMAWEHAMRYSLERQQFGVPIFSHQAVSNMLADSKTWLDAGWLMTCRAALAKEKGLPFGKLAAMAKLYASEHAGKICDIALQVHGGNGYTNDFPIERAYRDVRVSRIYEGTSEIQRLVIARRLLDEAKAKT